MQVRTVDQAGLHRLQGCATLDSSAAVARLHQLKVFALLGSTALMGLIHPSLAPLVPFRTLKDFNQLRIVSHVIRATFAMVMICR